MLTILSVLDLLVETVIKLTVSVVLSIMISFAIPITIFYSGTRAVDKTAGLEPNTTFCRVIKLGWQGGKLILSEIIK